MATAKRDGTKTAVNTGEIYEDGNPYAAFDSEFSWTKENEESPTTIEFEKPGEFIIGSYNGPMDVHTDKVSDNSVASDGLPGFTLQTFRDVRNGELVALPNSYKLAEALKDVPVGVMCKVLFVKYVEMGNGRNAMKDLVVYTSK